MTNKEHAKKQATEIDAIIRGLQPETVSHLADILGKEVMKRGTNVKSFEIEKYFYFGNLTGVQVYINTGTNRQRTTKRDEVYSILK